MPKPKGRTAAQQVAKIFDDIFTAERGYADDPDDKGGATMHGISLRYIKGIGLDLDGNGVIDKRDIKLVTPEKAKQLYRADFYTSPRINRLPAIIQPFATDFAVHSGAPRAIICMQECMTYFPGHEDVHADGVIGPKTIAAAESIIAKHPQFFCLMYANARLEFMFKLAKRNPSQMKYIKTTKGGPGGWPRRVCALVHEMDTGPEYEHIPTWARGKGFTELVDDYLSVIYV